MGMYLPNIILLIILDAVRYDVFTELFKYKKMKGAYVKSFKNVYSASSWTLPSVVSLFSSTYPFTYSNLSITKRPCMIDLLKRKGYETILINSGNAFIEVSGLTTYFDLYIKHHYDIESSTSKSLLRKLKRTMHNSLEGVTKVSWIRNMLNNVTALIDTYNYVKEGCPPYKPLKTILAELKTTISRKSKADKFFIYIHAMDTHHPWIALPKFKDKLLKLLWYTFIKYYDTTLLHAKALKLMYEIYKESVKETVICLIDFINYTLSLDNEVLIVITADHGEGFGFNNKSDRFHEIYKPNIRLYTLFYDQLHIPLLFITNHEHAETKLQDIKDNILLSGVDIIPLIMYISRMHNSRSGKIMRYIDSLNFANYDETNHAERIVAVESPAYRKGYTWHEKTYAVITNEGYKLTVSPFFGIRLTNILKDKEEVYQLDYKDVIRELYSKYIALNKLRQRKRLAFMATFKLRNKLSAQNLRRK